MNAQNNFNTLAHSYFLTFSINLFQGCWCLVLLPACLTSPLAEVGSIGSHMSTTTEFTPTQYHIQTDEGDRRFFKYQTWGGQIRKENRLDDGTVIGSYGWVDANGLLRLYDYIADDKGYRIVKTRFVEVGKQDSIDGAKIEEALSVQTTQIPPVVFVKKLKNKNKDAIDNSISDNLFSNRKFELPLATSQVDIAASSSRLQRKISSQDGSSVTVNVQPIFDLEPFPEIERTNPSPQISLTTEPLVARGEGSRTVYNPITETEVNENEENVATNILTPREVARSRSEDGRSMFVVKRRRPHSLPQPYTGSVMLDYQTRRAYHLEQQSRDGRRNGEYGYIDPIGVRRVVKYATGPHGEIVKQKENDFVGKETYFEAS